MFNHGILYQRGKRWDHVAGMEQIRKGSNKGAMKFYFVQLNRLEREQKNGTRTMKKDFFATIQLHMTKNTSSEAVFLVMYNPSTSKL
jgi:hypothetical protein